MAEAALLHSGDSTFDNPLGEALLTTSLHSGVADPRTQDARLAFQAQLAHTPTTVSKH